MVQDQGESIPVAAAAPTAADLQRRDVSPLTLYKQATPAGAAAYFSEKSEIAPLLPLRNSRHLSQRHPSTSYRPRRSARDIFKMVVWSSMAAAGLLALSHLSFSGLVGASPMPGSKSAREMEAYDAASGDRLGAVASENHICSSAGIEMLERGGNAADAVGLLCRVTCYCLDGGLSFVINSDGCDRILCWCDR